MSDSCIYQETFYNKKREYVKCKKPDDGCGGTGTSSLFSAYRTEGKAEGKRIRKGTAAFSSHPLYGGYSMQSRNLI
jgi:hypothetical protein